MGNSGGKKRDWGGKKGGRGERLCANSLMSSNQLSTKSSFARRHTTSQAATSPSSPEMPTAALPTSSAISEKSQTRTRGWGRKHTIRYTRRWYAGTAVVAQRWKHQHRLLGFSVQPRGGGFWCHNVCNRWLLTVGMRKIECSV